MKFILITGGIKSGKSSYALIKLQDRLKEFEKYTAYFVATLIPFDNEMEEKIQKHKEERKNYNIKNLILFEEPINIDEIIVNIPSKSIIILDCITIWLNNLFYNTNDFEKVEIKAFEKIDNILNLKERRKESSLSNELIIVTNEVNLGNIPNDNLTRRYNHLLGTINKKLASFSDEVYFMISGIPLRIK
ncbi:MAG: bifunctional adenosylcobinamide kinase/adenosylcobinamide-phosphate guanylyltransferase [Spirochaetes bacterium]|nr:bifunctional adenosylcobinamide kinase/adenosylcobinamide-phosphate guanylyltransferase [Spirochaetota bacterium]